MAEAPLIHTFINGLSEDVGTGEVSPVYGSAVNTITQGSDSRLSVQNVVRVKGNPGAGEYGDLEAGIAATTGATANSPYTLIVGPGLYTPLAPIVVPPFVTIKVEGHGTVIVEPDDPDNDIFQITSSSSRVQGFTLRGATGANAAAIRVTSAAAPTILDFITIQNCTYGIVVESTATVAQAVLRNIRIISGATTKHFLYIKSNSGLDAIARIWSALYTDDLGTALISGVHIEGDGSRFDANNLLMRSTTGVGDGIFVTDGGELVTQTGFESEGFNNNLFVENAGADPIIRTVPCMLRAGVTYDLNIQHPGTMGSLEAKANTVTKVFVDPDAPIKLILTDPASSNTRGLFIKGDLLQADIFARQANISKLLRETTTLGLISGGEISRDSGLDITVNSGTGFLSDPVDFFIKEISWASAGLTLPASTASYIYVDTNGVVTSATSFPSLETIILLGRVVTRATNIIFVESSSMNLPHVGNKNTGFARRYVGPLFHGVGAVTTESGTRNLDVSPSEYIYGYNEYTPSGATPITFSSFYRDGLGGFTEVTGQTQIDNAFFDDGTGTLAAISSGNYAKGALYLVGDGAEEFYFFVYSQVQYASEIAAEGGDLPTPPPFFTDAVALIASITVQEGNASIVTITNESPRLSFQASGVSASSDHGNLFGLLDDDHTQYLLASGTRAMTGPLNMGGQQITNVGNVDGVDVSAHASRHNPGGADAVTTAAPVTIGTANAEGAATSLSRSNHVHDHGSQTTPTHHAVATAVANGFMSSTDKAKLDAISGTRIFKAGTITAATFSGNPKKATVTFGTAFPNTNYSFVVLGGDGRSWTYESKLAGSIVVSAGANTALTADVMWIAIDHGETLE